MDTTDNSTSGDTTGSHAAAVSDTKLKTEKRILNLSLAGSIAFLIAEVIFAIFTGSKAVLMDCVYDIADLIMIGPFMVLIPLLYKPTTEKRPYGFSQVESLFVLIKYCILLGVDAVLVINCVKSILSGGNEVDASVLAIFELAVSVGCVLMYLVLRRFQRKYSSPSIKAELFIWKLDAFSTLGVGCAFAVNILLLRTPLSFICPYVDPGIAVILAVILAREPVEMILDSLRSLVLFAPEDEIKDKITEICQDILRREGCRLTFLDLIKTGRKVWAEAYFLPSGNSIDLSRMQQACTEITEAVQRNFDSIYIELIPDMEEYHVLAPEEVRARRAELVRYLQEQELRKQKKSESR